MQNARFYFCILQKLAARSAKKCKMQDAKIKNCILQQQIRRLIQKSAKCKLHARFFPLISFCKLQQIFGCKKFLISKYPPLLGMAQARKFKHVISLILYLQKIPLAGKFIYYGCYCFANAQFDLDAGFGKPVDPIGKNF